MAEDREDKEMQGNQGGEGPEGPGGSGVAVVGEGRGTQTGKHQGEGEAGAQMKPGPSLEELKAKLGITPRTTSKRSEGGAAGRERRPKAEDLQFTLNVPVGGPAEEEGGATLAMPLTAAEDLGVETPSAGKSAKVWIIGLVVVGLGALVVGLLFGKVMESRKIQNFEIKEARFILRQIKTATGEKLTAEEGTILNVVQAHIEDTNRTYNQLRKATTPQDQQAAMAELEKYLERCMEYVQKQPVFSIEAIFPDVVFDQKLAAKVVNYVHAVQRLYDQTAILAMEGQIKKRVKGPEDRPMIQLMYVEPVKRDGETWLKGTFISKIDKERKVTTGGKVLYPVLPFGATKGFVAETSQLAEVDVAPIARAKAQTYIRSIDAKISRALQKTKQAADQADFEFLEKELQKRANEEPLFTIF